MLQALKKISDLTKEIKETQGAPMSNHHGRAQLMAHLGEELESLCLHTIDVMRNVFDYAMEKQVYQKEAVGFVLQGPPPPLMPRPCSWSLAQAFMRS